MKLAGVNTQIVDVANGAASVSAFALNDVTLKSGDIVKAFCWENSTQKPIKLSDDSGVNQITFSIN